MLQWLKINCFLKFGMADFSIKLLRNSGFKPVLVGNPGGKSSLVKGTYVGVGTIEIHLRET